MKKVLKILLASVLVCYILFYVFYIRNVQNDEKRVCSGIEIVVKDSTERHFVKSKDIQRILTQARISPVGKPLSSLNTEAVERKLRAHSQLALVEVYKTPSGIMHLNVNQRIPVLRVITPSANYYVDKKGAIMPPTSHFVIQVPLAVGSIDTKFAVEKILPFALYLQSNEFWYNQVEQIVVLPSKDVELVPRVGTHRILLGTLDSYDTKLENLRLFYDQAIPKVGWNKYKQINLSFKDQVICTRN